MYIWYAVKWTKLNQTKPNQTISQTFETIFVLQEKTLNLIKEQTQY